jgi:hypothetical protein
MNAALGGESAGGLGTPEFDVTHIGGGPNAFVASQPRGSVGGVTPSKFSVNTIGTKQPEHEGVGCGVAPTASEISARLQPSGSREASTRQSAAMSIATPPNAAIDSMRRILISRGVFIGLTRTR